MSVNRGVSLVCSSEREEGRCFTDPAETAPALWIF